MLQTPSHLFFENREMIQLDEEPCFSTGWFNLFAGNLILIFDINDLWFPCVCAGNHDELFEAAKSSN